MHPTTTTLAPAVFARLAYLVAQPHAGGVQPAGRAQALAATLREIASIPTLRELHLSPATLTAALRLLSKPFPTTEAATEEAPNVQGRRATCAALAFWCDHTWMTAPIDDIRHDSDPRWMEGDVPPVSERGTIYLEEALAVWRAIAVHFLGLADGSPRHAAMTNTYAREAAELERWVALGRMSLYDLLIAAGTRPTTGEAA